MSSAHPDILCVGAVLWDVIGRSPAPMAPGADVPGRIRHVPGGVALNVAVALAARRQSVAVLGAVGADPEGDALLAAVRALGVATDWMQRLPDWPTDTYMAIEDSQGLIAAIADAHSLEAAGDRVLAPLRDGTFGSAESPWRGTVVIDGNLTVPQLEAIAADPALRRADLRVVPASPGKAERLAPLLGLDHATLYLNRAEAETLAGHPCAGAAEAAAAVVARGAARVLVTDGARPAACARRGAKVLTQAPPSVTIARVTGAGDCFMAAHMVAERAGADRAAALDAAIRAAAAHVAGEGHDPQPIFKEPPMTDLPLSFTPEVRQALNAGRPVVALESTIITHGMPYPKNLQMARDVEQAIREAGAVPATIALMEGRIHIGLDDAALEMLARATDVMKVSRADLAVCLVTRRTGATTVAATMICAALAGIRVFATGGIGGVHRGVQDTMDISADLYELAATSVTVVSAGAKAILDLPRTFEYLETLGVPVIAVGQNTIPAFWSRDSGLPAPLRLDDPAQIAEAARMRRALGLPGGQLVVNPIPLDAEIPRPEIMPVVEQALAEAAAQGIAAKAVTPFLLDRIFDLTEGRSLTANIALVLANARLAARIAAAGA